MKGIFIYQWLKVIFSTFYLNHLNRLLKKLLIFNSQDKNYKKRKTIFSIPMSKTIRPCNSITWNLDPKTIIHLYTIQLEPWDLTANGKISPEKKKKKSQTSYGLSPSPMGRTIGLPYFFSPSGNQNFGNLQWDSETLCKCKKTQQVHSLCIFYSSVLFSIFLNKIVNFLFGSLETEGKFL